jgi:hypothetical protein
MGSQLVAPPPLPGTPVTKGAYRRKSADSFVTAQVVPFQNPDFSTHCGVATEFQSVTSQYA